MSNNSLSCAFFHQNAISSEWIAEKEAYLCKDSSASGVIRFVLGEKGIPDCQSICSRYEDSTSPPPCRVISEMNVLFDDERDAASGNIESAAVSCIGLVLDKRARVGDDD